MFIFMNIYFCYVINHIIINIATNHNITISPFANLTHPLATNSGLPIITDLSYCNITK